MLIPFQNINATNNFKQALPYLFIYKKYISYNDMKLPHNLAINFM